MFRSYKPLDESLKEAQLPSVKPSDGEKFANIDIIFNIKSRSQLQSTSAALMMF